MQKTGFIALDLATELFIECEKLNVQKPVKDQLLRASLSISLNITEGSGRIHSKDRRRFYSIAMASLRETQCLLRIISNKKLLEDSDRLGGLIFGLIRNSG